MITNDLMNLRQLTIGVIP